MSSRNPPIDQDGNPLFEAGFMYPLKDPTRYDDDFGEGYNFALVDDEANPGECWMHDCWIVNALGEKHPGMTESPVPVRCDDVDMHGRRPNPMGKRANNWTGGVEPPTIDAEVEIEEPRAAYALPRM